MKSNLALGLRGTIVDVFILRRMQEEYHTKGKMLYMSFVDIEKALDRVPRKVLEWVMRNIRGFVRSVISLYEGVKASQGAF